MSDYHVEELRAISKLTKNENIKNAICKTVLAEAEERNIRINKILEEVPATIRWNIEKEIYKIQYKMKKPTNIDKFADIKFVEVIERDWALCGSWVVLKINDQEIEFDHILSTGGHTSWGEDGDCIETGPWGVCNLPEYLEPYNEEITKIINKNVDWGCCGGCI